MEDKYIINVLSPFVFEDCHIKGTVNVPLERLADYVRQTPKDTEIIVYCAHYECNASRKAWHLLNDLGFTNVYAYEGGIAEWFQQKLPIKGYCKLDFLREIYKKQEKDPKVKEISIKDLKKKLNLN